MWKARLYAPVNYSSKVVGLAESHFNNDEDVFDDAVVSKRIFKAKGLRIEQV